MAGSKSDYLESKALDDWYGSGDPETIYIKLYTVAPDDTGGGTEVSTDDWTNYAAAAVTNNSTNWPAAVDGVKSNGTAVDFDVAVIVNPVTVVAAALFDPEANMLHWGTLENPKTINNGDPVYFPIGGIILVED